MQISFKSELDKLSKNLSKIQLNVLKRSTVQALNKTVAKVKAEANRAIREEANVSARQLRTDIVVSKANKNRMIATVDSGNSRATNLIEYVGGNLNRFRNRTNKGRYTKSAQQGVRAKPYEKVQSFRGAFIGNAKGSGKKLVFKRDSQGRNSGISVVYGPSPRQIFRKQTTIDRLKAKSAQEFSIELDRAIRLGMSRLSK